MKNNRVDVPKESAEQMELIEWAERLSVRTPELALLFAIPNGGSRNKIEAANLKRQGVKRGVPDLCLPVPKSGKHGLYIEMKRPHGYRSRVEPEQRAWHTALIAQGYECRVCYGADEAIRTIEDYLALR